MERGNNKYKKTFNDERAKHPRKFIKAKSNRLMRRDGARTAEELQAEAESGEKKNEKTDSDN